MSVKLRLQRFGRRKYPLYHIVVADSRSPRDGKFIETIGSYNPNTHPATIEVDSDRALEWLHNGAIPSVTVRRILKFQGVLYRKHLLRGVRKGVLTEEEADKKFADWLKENSEKMMGKVEKIKAEADKKAEEQLKAEAEISAKRAEALQAKRAEEAGEEEVEEAEPEAAEQDEEAPKAAAEAENTAEEAKEKAEEAEAKAEEAEAKAEEAEAKKEEEQEVKKEEEKPEEEEKKSEE